MTQRERKMMWTLVVLSSVVGVGLLAWLVFLKPYMDSQRTLAALDDEIRDKSSAIALKTKERRQVERFRFMSLSGAPNDAVNEYEKFLRPLLNSSGLSADKIHAQIQEAAKSASGAGAAAKKGSPHTVITFTVDAKGELGSVMTFLKLMDEAKYTHRVKTLNLAQETGKEGTGWLNARIVIEALIVNKAERYANLPGRLAALDALAGLRGAPIGMNLAPWALAVSPVGPLGKAKPAPRSEHYAEVSKRNPFIGLKPVVLVDVGEEFPEPQGIDMRKWWKLSAVYHTNVNNFALRPRMAILRNYLEGPSSTLGYQKLLTIPMSGYDKFRIKDERGRDQVQALVLRIDDRDVYFSVDGKYYSIHAGESVYEAMAERGALSRAEAERLGLVSSAAKQDTTKEEDTK